MTPGPDPLLGGPRPAANVDNEAELRDALDRATKLEQRVAATDDRQFLSAAAEAIAVADAALANPSATARAELAILAGGRIEYSSADPHELTITTYEALANANAVQAHYSDRPELMAMWDPDRIRALHQAAGGAELDNDDLVDVIESIACSKCGCTDLIGCPTGCSSIVGPGPGQVCSECAP